MEYVDLKGFEDKYEIATKYPYQIRNKKNNRILSECARDDGYIVVSLNRVQYLKHRLIAIQFIDNPDSYPCVDHINHNKADNRIKNLRWTSQQENCKNKKSYKDREYNYFEYDELNNEDMIVVNEYNKYEFKDYYYNPDTDKFYYDTKENYKELHINHNKNGVIFVNMIDINNKSIRVYIKKFKKMYNFIE